MISVGFFSHFLKIDDALVGVMSCMSKILASLVYSFATEDWMMYLAPLVEIVNGTSFIAMRSIASKLVPTDELGKVNSLFGVCESLMPLVYGPIYSSVYASTMNTLPGTFFLLGGCLTAPAVVAFLWLYREHRRDRATLERAMRKEKSSKTEEREANGSVAVETKTENDKELRVQIMMNDKQSESKAYDNPTFITEHL
ncbi:solute carrier family 46 member 3-like [Fopius arisanus]|uniref:Solute carrier family 46 member 3-like n=1 Tax=Fopius arisanus TaxID=64838 RepID=A0A9R1TXU5_9HYME|nr:PREDICTED: solute carrier family 46 member 3-like [Fopius arisanus]